MNVVPIQDRQGESLMSDSYRSSGLHFQLPASADCDHPRGSLVCLGFGVQGHMGSCCFSNARPGMSGVDRKEQREAFGGRGLCWRISRGWLSLSKVICCGVDIESRGKMTRYAECCNSLSSRSRTIHRGGQSCFCGTAHSLPVFLPSPAPSFNPTWIIV